MSKIIDAAGIELTNPIPTVSHAVPTGNQVLVELLTPNEILGTNLHLGENTKSVNGAPQAYVLATGPAIKDWGVQVGDRVVLSGSFTPLPEVVSKNGRAQGCVDPHMIKAVLVENKK